ncbi:hypothetical protein ACFSSA_02795 [Luteolibacter algae]|uniref:EF-hand domain-containing protein n=1 Tax=Luteolibacter algae TaxID=454151 RepID=A0ABW5D7L2_9BACT
MKISLLCLFGLSAALHAEVSPETEKVLTETSEISSRHIRLALSEVDESGEKLVPLVSALRRMGFGNPPPVHPEMKKSEAELAQMPEKDRKIYEDHHAERLSRMAQMGQADVEYLKDLDLDKNLKLDEAEIRDSIRGQLVFLLEDKMKVDGDGDGKLNIKEYSLGVPVRGEIEEDGVDWHQRGHFEGDDLNKDGMIDESEVVSHFAADLGLKAVQVHLAASLSNLDGNEDGKIDQSEYSEFAADDETVWKHLKGDSDTVPVSEIWQRTYWLPVSEMLPLLE